MTLRRWALRASDAIGTSVSSGATVRVLDLPIVGGSHPQPVFTNLVATNLPVSYVI